MHLQPVLALTTRELELRLHGRAFTHRFDQQHGAGMVGHRVFLGELQAHLLLELIWLQSHVFHVVQRQFLQFQGFAVQDHLEIRDWTGIVVSGLVGPAVFEVIHTQ